MLHLRVGRGAAAPVTAQRKVRTPKKLLGCGPKGVPGQLTAGRSDPTESATEKIPPGYPWPGKGEMVGQEPTAAAATTQAWQTPWGARPNKPATPFALRR